MRWLMPQPCIGARVRVLRTRRSRVPRRTSAAVGGGVGMREWRVASGEWRASLGSRQMVWRLLSKVKRSGAYVTHGAVLMAVKYVVDATLIEVFAGRFWTPWDYLTTGADFAHSKLAGAPGALLPLLGVWTLPFLWIGLTMTLRRALDARR